MTATASPQISTAFIRIAELGLAVGTGNLKDREPWDYAFGDPNGVSEWRMYVNGKRVAADCNGVTIPPTSAYIEFNGWPFGFLNPGGGTCANGEVANEDTLIAALEAEIIRVGGTPSEIPDDR